MFKFSKYPVMCTDRHIDVQRETIIPHHYHVAGYKKKKKKKNLPKRIQELQALPKHSPESEKDTQQFSF